MIGILDISAFELIVRPSHFLGEKIAYPLDDVVYAIGDLFQCHVEGQQTTQSLY